jgi:hypothetical protein
VAVRRVLVEAGRRLLGETHGRRAVVALQVGGVLASECLRHLSQAGLALEVGTAASGGQGSEVDLVEDLGHARGTVLEVELDPVLTVQHHLSREDLAGDGVHGRGGLGVELRAALEVDQQPGSDAAGSRDRVDGAGSTASDAGGDHRVAATRTAAATGTSGATLAAASAGAGRGGRGVAAAATLTAGRGGAGGTAGSTSVAARTAGAAADVSAPAAAGLAAVGVGRIAGIAEARAVEEACRGAGDADAEAEVSDDVKRDSSHDGYVLLLSQPFSRDE